MNKRMTTAISAAFIALIATTVCSCEQDRVVAATVRPMITTTEDFYETYETYDNNGVPHEPVVAVIHEVGEEPVFDVSGEIDVNNENDTNIGNIETAAPVNAVETEETIPLTPREKPITNRIYLQGPNLVYVGESFDFTYYVSSKNADRATILWNIDGDAGTLSPDGHFTADKAGVVVLTVSDISNGLTDKLVVHCVETPMDVDFVVEVNGIQIANKTYPVPRDYAPELSPEAEEAFYRLVAAGREDGVEITFNSGFRSYETQIGSYGRWSGLWGVEAADRVSARPGHSEHQLGLAIDVCNVMSEFANTEEAKWLRNNCYKFGFILRYPSYESEPITGYAFEPWHIRYLGEELAYDVTASGLTLEEYLGIDSYYRIESFEEETGYPLNLPDEESETVS